MLKSGHMNLTLEIGTFGWNWYPHLWLYRQSEHSKGALGFAWLLLHLRIDWSNELSSRSYIEKGLHGEDAKPYPSIELDWRKRA